MVCPAVNMTGAVTLVLLTVGVQVKGTPVTALPVMLIIKTVRNRQRNWRGQWDAISICPVAGGNQR